MVSRVWVLPFFFHRPSSWACRVFDCVATYTSIFPHKPVQSFLDGRKKQRKQLMEGNTFSSDSLYQIRFTVFLHEITLLGKYCCQEFVLAREYCWDVNQTTKTYLLPAFLDFNYLCMLHSDLYSFFFCFKWLGNENWKCMFQNWCFLIDLIISCGDLKFCFLSLQ